MGENQNTQKVSFWARPWLMVCGTVLQLAECGGWTFIAVVAIKDVTGFSSKSEKIAYVTIFLALAVVAIGIIFGCASKWFVKITLDKTGIITKSGLKKAVVRPYSDYHYIYRGWYWHGSGGFGKNVYYIVLSHRRLSDKQLQQINLAAIKSYK